MKEESLLLLSDLQKLINQVVLIDYTIIILGGKSMTRLDCNVEKCAYNADNCCKLREIDVKGTKAKKACDTQCGSFSNKACDCEVSAELAIHKETDVHCDAAKCKYNDHNSCMANQIGIKKNCTPNKCSTECASFECQA